MKRSLGAKTLVYPTPVFVVGSYDEQDRPNVMTAAWAGISCSLPPAVTVSIREATYTYGNIMKRKAFTISIPDEKHWEEADYFGHASGRNEDKFEKSGLTAVRSDVVDAPYVEEFPFIVECKLLQTVKIGLHTQFIGEIIDLKADEDLLQDSKIPLIEQLRPLVFVPVARDYYGIGGKVGSATPKK